MKNCDMCGTKIENNKCSCGTWMNDEKIHPLKNALEYFHDSKKTTIAMDAPHLGCAAIFFKGNYLDCKEVRDFVFKLKKIPYYED